MRAIQRLLALSAALLRSAHTPVVLSAISMTMVACAPGTGSVSTASPSSTPAVAPDATTPAVTESPVPADLAAAEASLAASSQELTALLVEGTELAVIVPDAAERIIALGHDPVEPPVVRSLRLPAAAPTSRQLLTRRGALADGAALGVGTLTLLVESTLQRGAEQAASGTPSGESSPTDPADGSPNWLTVTDGRLDVHFADTRSSETAEGSLTVTSDLTATVGACPAAGGKVDGDLVVDVRIAVAAPTGEATVAYRLEVDLVGHVSDAARLIGHEMTVSGSATESARTRRGGGDVGDVIEGYFLEGGSSTSFTGSIGSRDLAVAVLTGPGVTRASQDVDARRAQSFLDAQHGLAMMLSTIVLEHAQTFWSSGACVDAMLTPSDDPQRLAAGQAITIEIDAVSATDGQPAGGTAVASLAAGEGLLTPADDPQPVIATVSYTAPADGSAGSVTVETRSMRGVGRARLDLAGVQGYTVDGVLDVFHAAGSKCGGPAGTWSIALTAEVDGFQFVGTLTVELDESSTGTYRLVGTTSGSGISIAQQGRGIARFVEHADGSGELTIEGIAYARGAVAVRSVPVMPATEPC